MFLRPPGRRLPKITEVKRLTIRPGDRLVVRVDRELTDAEVDEVKANVSAAFKGTNYRPPILLVEGDVDIEVIGPEADGG